MKNKAIILLSGGLDSVVSLAKARKQMSVVLAVTFNYGQKSFNNEYISSSKIAKFYDVEHIVVNLPWLASISTSSLNTESAIPSLCISDLDDVIKSKETSNSVWVPNRNSLFVNIAASIAESKGMNRIILGANVEEGATFKDNSIDFVNAINKLFNYSVNSELVLCAPLISMNKEQIVKLGLELDVPFELIYSCYNSSVKHCGKCESCNRLKRALALNNRHDIIELLFEREKL